LKNALLKSVFATRRLVLSSLFMAVFVILSAAPTFPIIGVAGGKFALSDILPALYGILLGLLQGTVVVLLGAILRFSVKPPIFLFLDFLTPVTNALIAGLLWRRKTWAALLVYFVALIAFLTAPFTILFVRIDLPGFSVDLPFHWLHLLAVPVSLVSVRFDESKGSTAAWIRVFGCSLLGTMGQHSIGSALFEYVFGLIGMKSMEYFITTWYTVFWIYPVERLVLALTSTIIGVSLIRILPRMLEQV